VVLGFYNLLALLPSVTEKRSRLRPLEKVSWRIRIAALGCPYAIEAHARTLTLHLDEEG
jgi:hypothetical protein